jgi:dienelactone hydrolase
MTHTSPTVVLVHGAFADGSSYASVTKELLAEGIQVIVPLILHRSSAISMDPSFSSATPTAGRS